MQLMNPRQSVTLCLARGQIVSLVELERPLPVVCESGIAWITVEGASVDLVLRAGERAVVPAGRLVVAQALPEARIVLGAGELVAAA